MVRVTEVSERTLDRDDAEYEDVSSGGDSDAAYTDTEEISTGLIEGGDSGRGGLCSNLLLFVPSWLLRRGRWSAKLYSRITRLVSLVGSAAWIFTTSMLLVGLPVLFAYDRDKALQEQQLIGLPPAVSTK